MPIELGIIGGSGLYRMADLTDVEEYVIETPFGPPSDSITLGTLQGMRIAFIPRHGRAHQHSPSRVPARANFWALKQLGVRWVVSVSAVGSLKEEVAPLDFVIPDQVIDRTVRRPRSFFDEEGPVVHVALDEPFCPELRWALAQSAIASGVRVHEKGTYLCIEGPQFSTRAESQLYRSWGLDVIGMTAMPEVRLAREAELCFAIVALVTDYDVWHAEEEPVNVSVVLQRLHQNIEAAQRMIRELIPRLRTVPGQCACQTALQHAIVTRPEAISAEVRQRYALLLGKYLSS